MLLPFLLVCQPQGSFSDFRIFFPQGGICRGARAKTHPEVGTSAPDKSQTKCVSYDGGDSGKASKAGTAVYCDLVTFSTNN